MSEPTSLRREISAVHGVEAIAAPRPAVRAATRSDRSLLPLGIVAVLLAASAPLYFVRGIGIFDDSVFLKAGQLILDGLTPYRDFYDNKPPGLYYVAAAIAAIGGRGWLAPRIFLFLFAAVFQVALVRWLHQQFGTRPAAIGALLIGLSYPLCQGYSLHTEPFGAAAAFAACVVVLADTSSRRRWAVAGALLGLGVVFKQTGVLYVAAFAAFALLESRHQPARFATFIGRMASLSAGFIAALAPVALIFTAAGLGPLLFESAVTDVILRAGDAQADWYSVPETWVRCPALVAFLGVAFLLAVSRPARKAMDETRSRAFVLYSLVGVIAILPTLRLNGVGHYLQPGAFAFSVACALFLDSFLRNAKGAWKWPVSAATVALIAAYSAALGAASVQVVREDRLRKDLLLQDEIRQVLDASLTAEDRVLCVSAGSAARLYLMSGRRPFNRSLYFYSSIERLFSLEDARRLLFEGRPPAAIVDVDPRSGRPELYDPEIERLRAVYDITPIGPQTAHYLLVLVRHDRKARPARPAL